MGKLEIAVNAFYIISTFAKLFHRPDRTIWRASFGPWATRLTPFYGFNINEHRRLYPHRLATPHSQDGSLYTSL